MVQAVCAILTVVKECGIAPRRMPQNLARNGAQSLPRVGQGRAGRVDGLALLALPNTHSHTRSLPV